MAGLGENVKRHFPLRTARDVIALFETQLEEEPNLGLLSIVVGYIENLLTCHRLPATLPSTSSDELVTQVDDECVYSSTSASNEPAAFPTVEFSVIEALYTKFRNQIKGSIDLSLCGPKANTGAKFATRELVKKVSDIIWGSLTRSYYKDRAHLQSLYSYLTGNKLDCFGVAFAVVAAFQVLGFRDVHLALSEDHAWVIYGKDQEKTAEVTWHGKGNEDKRGQPVTCNVTDKSWLYLNGFPVKCTRHMEVAALVSSINPSINATSDSNEVACLQQQLLWLLYDLNHLQKYPMALGNLGDLEEITPSPGRPPPIELFQESILTSQSLYNNQHVYPYTYLGGYLYRNGHYKQALQAWANAAGVIKKYNYGREDEEIYKEFLEIANELIPHVLKVISATGVEPSGESDIPLLQDPQCFIEILRFMDGLCEWEEGSSKPVLHIGWAKPLVSTIGKFPGAVRSQVNILLCVDKPDELEETVTIEQKDEKNYPAKTKFKNGKVDLGVNGSEQKTLKIRKKDSIGTSANENVKKEKLHQRHELGQETEFLKNLETQIDPEDKPHPNIIALAAACSDNILNPEYLLGSGEPFSPKSSNSSPLFVEDKEVGRTKSNGTPSSNLVIEAVLKSECSDKLLEVGDKPDSTSVILTSQKMKGLKELLLAEKLNTSAIQLQLTAQSQVQVVRRGRHASEIDFVSCGRSTKRSRRE